MNLYQLDLRDYEQQSDLVQKNSKNGKILQIKGMVLKMPKWVNDIYIYEMNLSIWKQYTWMDKYTQVITSLS